MFDLCGSFGGVFKELVCGFISLDGSKVFPYLLNLHSMTYMN